MNKSFLLFLALSSSYISFANSLTPELVAVKEPSRYESFVKLQKVISAVELLYVDDINLSTIVDKSINGLLHELDAHSSMLNKDSYKDMKVETKGEFGGLGIVVGQRDGALTVISPIDDTPAFEAGVKAGDIILKIDNLSTINMSLSDSVDIMRGKVGTPIEITIVRKGELEPIKIKIIRDVIKIKSVYAKTINKDILYLRVASFMNMNISEDLKKAILKHKDTTKAIVLDLRNNPGGLLGEAIDTIDLFVDEGIAVSQKGRVESENQVYKLSQRATITDVPLVVLVNQGSASASEIVSGGLQDLKRAVVMGKNSFGKGSVQRIIPIKNDGSEAIKLTIAKYYLPSGRTIQAKGITPDIEVYAGKVISEKKSEFAIKESNMIKHLKGELSKVDSNETSVTKKNNLKDNIEDINKTIITKEDLLKDNQLNSAVNVLKSLILMNKN
ncbi:MAG: S41 family peptidase [Campylobacterota bacterium]|nr:S41 family peptidase [Campylobacterota bacterium]